jgi:hypothetical protein
LWDNSEIFFEFICQGILEYLFPDFRDITEGGDRNNDCFRSFRLTNHRRRKKKEGEGDEYMSHLVSYKWIRITQYIPQFGGFYKEVGILLGGCLTVKN